MFNIKKRNKGIREISTSKVVSYIVMIIVCLTILGPFLHELAKSLSHPFEVGSGNVVLLPRAFSEPEFIFTADKLYTDTLDNQEFPAELKGMFAQNSINLSDNVSANIIIKGSEWTISDNVTFEKYTFKVEENKLNIYYLSEPGFGVDFGNYYYFWRKQLERLSLAMANTMFLVLVGGILSVAAIVSFAFPLSRPRRNFRIGSIVIYLVVFCIIFQRPIIPLRITFQYLGLLNSLWAIVLNMLINPFLVILAITYFKSLPEDIYDAASIDGAHELTTFIKIILPLCKSIVATIFLMQAVGYWNSFLQAKLLITDPLLYPIQNYVQLIMTIGGDITETDYLRDPYANSESIKSALTILTTIPITVIYILLQKYFTRGLTSGSVKG